MILVETDLAWLGAIIDGEGSIIVHQQKSGYHQCRITITNSDDGILDKCEDILRTLNIFYTKRKCPITPLTKHQCTTVEINRIEECKHLIIYLHSYMHSNRKKIKIKEFFKYYNQSRIDGKRSNRRKGG